MSKLTTAETMVISKPSLCNKFQHCFILKAAFFKCLISAQVSRAFFLTTLSHSHTLVLQTVAPIHHIPLCRNRYSNTVLTDHLCICLRYMQYWTFILAGVKCTVKTAHAACCANMKKEETWKSSHAYSVLCVMCDIWNRSQEIPHSLGKSVYKQPL